MDQTIPEEYEEALTVTQGHSRETAQQYYVMKSMRKHATTACIAHKRLHGEFAPVDIPPPRPEEEEYLPADDPGPHLLLSFVFSLTLFSSSDG